MFAYRLKVIRRNLIHQKYFETVSDHLFELVTGENPKEDDYLEIENYTTEYLLLLIDYVGISIYEIKNCFKDVFRDFINKKNPQALPLLFSSLANSYQHENRYEIIVKIDNEFDGELLKAFQKTRTQNFVLFSRTGLINYLDKAEISNKMVLNRLMSEIDLQNDNKEYVYAKIEEKDLWRAIKKFKDTILQPFLGVCLYAGIRMDNPTDEYIVINQNYGESEKYIAKKKYFSDIYKPMVQAKADYSLVFQSYILNKDLYSSLEKTQIKEIIDEGIQLLPTYHDSASVLSRFSTIWFALETLYRKAKTEMNVIIQNYIAKLTADKILSGKILMICTQAKHLYHLKYLQANFIESALKSYDAIEEYDCGYLDWKRQDANQLIANYAKSFQTYYSKAKHLLYTIYRERNKQFHGAGGLELEYITGHLYDIVNESISFYIDYLNVYKNSDPNLDELLKIILNIDFYKSLSLEEEKDSYKQFCILYDSLRKI